MASFCLLLGPAMPASRVQHVSDMHSKPRLHDTTCCQTLNVCCIHDTTGCQKVEATVVQPVVKPGCTTRFDNRLNEQWLLLFISRLFSAVADWLSNILLHMVCISANLYPVYTIQPVVKAVVQPV